VNAPGQCLPPFPPYTRQTAAARARRGFWLLLWLILGCQSALAALTDEAFTREVATSLRAALPGYKVEITDKLQIHIKNDAGQESTAFLDNAYNQYLGDPDARQKIIDTMVAAFVESMAADEVPLDPQNIIPIIKDRGWIAEIRKNVAKRGEKEPDLQVFEDFNDELVIVYAEDTPNSMRYFGPADLEKAGIKRDQLRGLAVDNLLRILPKIERQDGELFSMVTAGGNYEASLLLVEDIWSGGNFKVEGDIVVAVPSRDLLLVTGSRNAAGIARLREIAQEVIGEGSYTLTDALFVYRNGKFQRLRD
jgi:uncharacterized protein YtpQ (UPF0354 family)